MGLVDRICSGDIWIQATLFSVTLTLMWKWLHRKKYNLPPGPRPIPFLGNQLRKDGMTFKQTFNQWRGQYGPVYQFYLGTQPVIMISNIDALNEAYLTRAPDFASSPSVPSTDIITNNGKGLSFLPYTDKLIRNKKVAAKALRNYLGGDMLEMKVNEVVQDELPFWISDHDLVGPQGHILHIVFNIIHLMLYGSQVKREDIVYKRMLQLFDQHSDGDFMRYPEDGFPFLRYVWPSKAFKELISDMDFFDRHGQRQWQINVERFDRNNISTYTQYLYNASEEAEKGEKSSKNLLPRDEALRILGDIFFAGTGTTVHTLEWAILELASHPEVQEKVYHEIMEVVGASMPNSRHLSKMLYMKAVIKETLRIHHPAPFGLMHVTSTDTKLMGYDIPAKTFVLTDFDAIQRDPDQWEEADLFKPERFLEEDSDSRKMAPKSRSWVPFSIGPRSCVGENLSRHMMHFVLTGLLQKMKFSLPPGSQASFEAYDSWFFNVPKTQALVVTLR